MRRIKSEVRLKRKGSALCLYWVSIPQTANRALLYLLIVNLMYPSATTSQSHVLYATSPAPTFELELGLYPSIPRLRVLLSVTVLR